MTTLDIIVIVVFAVALVMGIRKGIIVQAGSLAGLLLGVLACHLFGDALTSWLISAGVLNELGHMWASILTNLLLFIVVYLSAHAVASFFKQVTHALSLGFFDRLAGGLFSAFKWMLVLSILFNMWLFLKPGTNFRALCPMAHGHAVQAILDLGPSLLDWAMDCAADAAG